MEKENKYYSLIENLIRKHRKFPGLESILDDIIDDVYSHSEVIVNSVNNESVINAYLEKVVSTSIITVPKKMNFHPEIKHRSLINHSHMKVDTRLVDKMINTPEKSKTIETQIDTPVQESQQILPETSVNNIETIDLNIHTDIPEEPESAMLEFEVPETKISSQTDALSPQELIKPEQEPLEKIEETEEYNLPEETYEQEHEALETIQAIEEFNLPEEALEQERETLEEVLEIQELNLPEDALEQETEKLEEVQEIQELNLPEDTLEQKTETLEEVLEIEDFNLPEEFSESESEIAEMIEDTEEFELDKYVDNNSNEEVAEPSMDSSADSNEETEEELTEEPAALEPIENSIEELEPDITNDELLESVDLDTLNIDANNNEDLSLSFDDDNLTELIPEETDDFDILQDNGEIVSLDTVTDNTIEKTNETKFSHTDYSKFDFVSSDTPDNDNTIDVALVIGALKEVADKNPDLNIFEIYNLKYKENLSVADIAEKLDISENKVIEALNEIIAVI